MTDNGLIKNKLISLNNKFERSFIGMYKKCLTYNYCFSNIISNIIFIQHQKL